MRWAALARTASRDSAPDAARYAGRDRGCLAALLAGQQPGHGLSTQIGARPARDWRQAAGTGRWVGRMIRLPAQATRKPWSDDEVAKLIAAYRTAITWGQV